MHDHLEAISWGGLAGVLTVAAILLQYWNLRQLTKHPAHKPLEYERLSISSKILEIYSGVQESFLYQILVVLKVGLQSFTFK